MAYLLGVRDKGKNYDMGEQQLDTTPMTFCFCTSLTLWPGLTTESRGGSILNKSEGTREDAAESSSW